MIRQATGPTLLTMLLGACNGQAIMMNSKRRSVEDLRAAVGASFQVSRPP